MSRPLLTRSTRKTGRTALLLAGALVLLGACAAVTGPHDPNATLGPSITEAAAGHEVAAWSML
jgi:hypothetical protein